jgi:hypothetical protein
MKYILFGGGNSNGGMTTAGIQSITNAIKRGDINAHSGIAYDARLGEFLLSRLLPQRLPGFRLSLSLAILRRRCGITDATKIMCSIFTNNNIDHLPPQL